MIGRRGLGNEACSKVLDRLDLMYGLVMQAKEERFAIINTGGNKTIDQDSVLLIFECYENVLSLMTPRLLT